MVSRWDGTRLYMDRETLADLFGVSVRTVRRHCVPATREPGHRGHALYDALTAADTLQQIAPRPARSRAQTILRRLQAAAQ